MNYPFYKCMECDTEIAELNLPIHPQQQYPKCPQCHSNKNVDIAIGNENTVIGSENTKLSMDTVIFSNKVNGNSKKGSGNIG